MKTTSKTLQYWQKKEKNRLTGSSQVYVRASLRKATHTGYSMNKPCTFGQGVARPFTTAHDRTCETRALEQEEA
jgi:hypothetical protein